MTATPSVALVTGGARRIGRAIAEDLARNGWAVAIHCHNSRDEAEVLATECRKAGARAEVIEADLAETASAGSLIASAQAALGPVTLLVNNASIFEKDGIGALDVELWHRQMAINLAAPVFLADAFAAALPAGVEGNIVNIIDQRAWKPTPHYISYQLSKSALLTATRTLAQALAPRIRVNAIGPGPTLPSPRQSEADFHRQAAAIPLQRATDLADFGRTIRYLVATPSITGQMIALDGGQHIAWQTPDILGTNE
jgi:NAD(P)-dependent dehydrogenase (short-subunit alcohol dehydrogenase family)